MEPANLDESDNGPIVTVRLPVLRWLTFLMGASLLMLMLVWSHNPTSTYVVSEGPIVDLTASTSGQVVDKELLSESRGKFLALTVRMRPVKRWETWLLSRQETELVKAQPQAAMNLSRSDEMVLSQAVASMIAASLLGGWPVQSIGAEVLWVPPYSHLGLQGVVAGDVVVAVVDQFGQRQEISSAKDLAAVVGAGGTSSGKPVTLIVIRTGVAFEASVGTSGNSGLEMVVRDALDETQPVLNVDMGEVTGSSAGLMLVLALVDAASPGDLTAGLVVTGTGVVDLKGSVSEVSGLNTKVLSSENARADVVFYPEEMYLSPQPGMKIVPVPVSSVLDAILWLCARGATDEICSRS